MQDHEGKAKETPLPQCNFYDTVISGCPDEWLLLQVASATSYPDTCFSDHQQDAPPCTEHCIQRSDPFEGRIVVPATISESCDYIRFHGKGELGLQ